MTRIYQVDSFTDVPFKGNPAAVCLLSQMPDEGWMQSVAAEMNLSETAFVVPIENGDYQLRWFTPTIEVELCGHATLASAHILRETGKALDAVRFMTLSGPLTASFRDDTIELDFPASNIDACTAPEELIDALQVQPLFCGKTRFDYLVQVSSAAMVRECQPNMNKLREFGLRGVMITSTSDQPEFDFVSRFFAPGAGIDEDPVTGSAHCALIPFWNNHFSKDILVGYQASQRGGIVSGRVNHDRVVLYGRAVTVLKCELVC